MIIPVFLDEGDPRPAREQLNERYRGGWVPASPEWMKFNRRTLRLTFPGDPPMTPLAIIRFRDEVIMRYPSSWVCIVQPSGKWEVAKMAMPEPSYDLLDAIRLPLLWHAGGPWDDARRAEWLRITGTTEATTKVMCDHLRVVLAFSVSSNEGKP